APAAGHGAWYVPHRQACPPPHLRAEEGYAGKCVMMPARGRGLGMAVTLITEGTLPMRAVLVSEFGGPEQLRLGRAADPVAGPGQTRIAVHAAGGDPVDGGHRAGGRWAG